MYLYIFLLFFGETDFLALPHPGPLRAASEEEGGLQPPARLDPIDCDPVFPLQKGS